MLRALTVALVAAAAVTAQVPEMPPIPQDLTTPVQIRLSYNGPKGMSIGWNTFQQLSKPTVQWGPHPGMLRYTSHSQSSVTYQSSRTWSNAVTLYPLNPATTYYYKIVSTNSSVLSFTTARTPGDQTPFTAALVVDMGVFGEDGLSTATTTSTGQSISNPLAAGEHTTIQTLVADAANYDFVLHPGDHAYADAWLKEIKAGYIPGSQYQPEGYVYEALNEQYWDQLSAVSSIKPYMAGAGNHEANCVNSKSGNTTEADCPVGQRDFTGFLNRFQYVLPASNTQTVHNNKRGMFPEGMTGMEKRMHALKTRATPTLSVPPFFYSFDNGMAHFLVFDTETDFPDGILAPEAPGGASGANDGPFGAYTNQQLDFIKQDLASVDRTKTPWIIAAGHRPWYTASEPCTTCQQAFEAVLQQYSVDLVVHGHVHNMELIPPIYAGTPDAAGWNNPKAPAYVVNGAAGHWQGLDAITPPVPSYISWYNSDSYGYSKLIFHSKNALEIQFIKSGDGSVLQTQTLTKNR